jgi:hypothetical protein
MPLSGPLIAGEAQFLFSDTDFGQPTRSSRFWLCGAFGSAQGRL